MADIVEKRLEFVIAADNQTQAALTAVENQLSGLTRAAESITAAFQGIIPAVKAAQAAIQSLGETGASSMSTISDAVARVNNTTWENLARGANVVANEIKAEFEQVGRSIEESLAVSMPTPKGGAPAGGGAGGESGRGGGGIFSYQGSMNLLYAGMSTGMMAAPMVAGIKEAVQSYLEFEQAAAQVNTMLHLNQQQFQELQNQLMELSKQVPQTATELAQGLYSVVGAGVPASNAMDVLRVAAEAAAAGQTDMDTATKALISVMDSYGMKATEVGKISDVLFAANQAGVMTFKDLASAIGTVAGPAANAGVSFEEVAAATAALTNTGLSAQRATEGLRALIMGIVSPTKQAQKEAAALGIEWDAAALKSKGLAGMIQEAIRATGGNEEALKKLIPNIAAYTAAVNLGGKGADSFKNALDQIKNSSGATGEALGAIQQTAGYQFQQFQKQAEELGQTFAVAVLPTLENFMKHLENLMTWFQNLSPGVRQLIADFVLWSAIILAGVTPILMFLSSVGQIVIVFRDLQIVSRVAQMMSGAFGLIRTGVTLLSSTVIGALRAMTVALISNPMVLLFVAIGLAVAALVYVIVTHWTQIRTFLVNTWNGIKATAQTVWGSITSFFSQIPGRIAGFFASLPEKIAEAFGFIVGVVVFGSVKVFNTVVDWFSQLPGKTAEFFTGVYNAVVQWLQNAWQTVVTGVPRIFHAIVDWFAQLPGTIWNWLVQVVTNVWNWATNLWNSANNAGSKFFTAIRDWIVQLPGNFANWLNDVINTIASFPGRLYNWGVNLVKSFIQGIKDWGGGIKDAFVQGFNNARAAIEGHSPPVEGPFRDIDKWGANVARAYIDGILSQRNAMRAAMMSFVQAGAVPVMNGPAVSVAGAGGGSVSGIPNRVQNVHIEHLNLPLQPAPEDPKGYAQRLAWSLKTMGR